jgi:hypothetical protein
MPAYTQYLNFKKCIRETRFWFINLTVSNDINILENLRTTAVWRNWFTSFWTYHFFLIFLHQLDMKWVLTQLRQAHAVMRQLKRRQQQNGNKSKTAG